MKKRKCLEPNCITILHKSHIGDYCYLHTTKENSPVGKLLKAAKGSPPSSPYQKIMEMWLGSCCDKNNCDKCRHTEICEAMFDTFYPMTEEGWKVKIKYMQTKNGGKDG